LQRLTDHALSVVCPVCGNGVKSSELSPQALMFCLTCGRGRRGADQADVFFDCLERALDRLYGPDEAQFRTKPE
jgi:hypothetical protein